MNNRIVGLIGAISFALCGAPAFADKSNFTKGPLILEFGETAIVESDLIIPEGTDFKVVFDVGDAAKENAPNRNFNTAARFLNMHAKAGIPAENLHVAIVVHGGAHKDILKPEFYSEAENSINPSLELVKALIDNGTKIYLCGQTAAYYDVTKDQLLPGVELSLSAMTAHALLLQDGYTANPF